MIAAVIVFIGTNNTITTQAFMTVAPLPRPIASPPYGFIRFIGGGLAPFAAGKLAAAYGDHLPFSIGAAAIVASIGVRASGHRLHAGVEETQALQLVPGSLDADADLVTA
ncbi:MAG TPA: hypothetical protein VFU10_04470 [Gaiellaceae bacterium]|nr:hypothetical protein [Gaiellaceae bacterium]